MHRTETRGGSRFRKTFVVLKDELDRLPVLHLFDSQLLHLRDALTQFTGQSSVCFGQILYGAVQCHFRSGCQLRRCLDRIVDLLLRKPECCEICLLSDDLLIPEQGSRLKFSGLLDQSFLHVFTTEKRRQQPLLVLELHVGGLHGSPRNGRHRSREVERHLLSESLEILLKTVELLLDVPGHLLKAICVGSDLDKELRYLLCHR